MSKLRLLMICRMAKPEEVLIVEDENGNIVRETMKDNDVLVQYKVQGQGEWRGAGVGGGGEEERDVDTQLGHGDGWVVKVVGVGLMG